MSGQPMVPPWLTFDVTNLEIFEPAAAISPSLIVPVNSPFILKATFTGTGLIWEWLKNLGVQWEAKFSAEGVGAHAQEYDFPVGNGNLAPGPNTFTTQINVPAGIDTPGIYEVTCLVRFPLCRGLTGFFKPLVIEVYP